MSIDVVVLPVAGLGSRFLPVTKVIPKEMLPIVDTPLIQLAVEEAARAGIKEVVLVNHGSKRALEDHFDRAAELEQMLESRGKTDLLAVAQRTLPAGMSVSAVRQPQALGLGHAILCAKTVVGNRPFAVMLVDDLIDAPDQGCLADMVALHQETGAFSVAVQDVPREHTNRYGVVSLAGMRVTALVEKPAPAVAPSTLAVVGRYILPPQIFAALEQVKPGAGGEIQLTDGIAALLADIEFRPHRFRGVRYDCGSKLGHLQANIAYALKDAELTANLVPWLQQQLQGEMIMSLRSSLPEWVDLQDKAAKIKNRHLKDLWIDSKRAEKFSLKVDQFYFDFSKQQLNEGELAGLFSLARACDMEREISALMSGAEVNNTEKRAALHSALRADSQENIQVDGANVVADVHASLARMENVVAQIHSRQWRGYSGKPIQDVVNIGVGGSDLGPFMVCNALGEFTAPQAKNLRLHFVSSIDGTQIADVLSTLRAETTLFIVSSKSFGTVDTLSNARTALQWMQAEAGDVDLVLQHHFIGISAKPEKMTEWGIPEANQIIFWDWVGGRFSLWSGIGLPIALQLGMEGFNALLEGARFMDRHFREAPLEQNLPALLGLIGVWNATFLDIRAHTVLPYDGRLKFFPTYLTQLEMESNGKSVNREGSPINYTTCPVLWGDVGPNAQHAFYQLLHQGTQAVSSDFIAPINRYAQHHHNQELQVQHQLALANCLAQSRVLMLGDACVENNALTPGFQRYRGNQPSTTLLIDALTPYTLGALIALYEHKVFVMSVIWDINPFDQWGVELGKKIADSTFAALQKENSANFEGFDGSTNALLSQMSVRGGKA